MHGSHVKRWLQRSMSCVLCSMSWIMRSKTYPLLALTDAALPLEEALQLLLGPVRHVVPDPVAGGADARTSAQEGEVVQVLLQVCAASAAAVSSTSLVCKDCKHLLIYPHKSCACIAHICNLI